MPLISGCVCTCCSWVIHFRPPNRRLPFIPYGPSMIHHQEMHQPQTNAKPANLLNGVAVGFYANQLAVPVSFRFLESVRSGLVSRFSRLQPSSLIHSQTSSLRGFTLSTSFFTARCSSRHSFDSTTSRPFFSVGLNFVGLHSLSCTFAHTQGRPGRLSIEVIPIPNRSIVLSPPGEF